MQPLMAVYNFKALIQSVLFLKHDFLFPLCFAYTNIRWVWSRKKIWKASLVKYLFLPVKVERKMFVSRFASRSIPTFIPVLQMSNKSLLAVIKLYYYIVYFMVLWNIRIEYCCNNDLNRICFNLYLITDQAYYFAISNC